MEIRGDRIKDQRERKGWSQSELARRAGVGQPLISDLERGVRKSATLDTLAKLARELTCTVDYLLRYDDRERPGTVLSPESVTLSLPTLISQGDDSYGEYSTFPLRDG